MIVNLMQKTIEENSLEELRIILESGADPNMKSAEGRPMIFLTENIEILSLLLEYGANPKLEDQYGFTIQDYTDDDKIISLLNENRNPIIITSSDKFNKYRGTFRGKTDRAKTRKLSKTQVTQPPLPDDISS
jgi:hypothetical protein